MKEIRHQEFSESMERFGFTSWEILDLPDIGLSYMPREEVVTKVLEIVRREQYDAIVSFHPHEVTPVFDHRNHVTAGEVARDVSAFADVRYWHPEYPAPDARPALLLWTTDTARGTHAIERNGEAKKKRNDHIEAVYPSQFPADKRSEWEAIFDRIQDPSGEGVIHEIYLRVR